MVPAHLLSMPASQATIHRNKYGLTNRSEFRGPGSRHNFDRDSDDYELDLDSKPKPYGRSGRIILLGDGTEQVLTDSDDAEMFDQSEEDSDADNQVKKDIPVSNAEIARHEREGTPAPQSNSNEQPAGHYGASHDSGTEIKGVADTPGSK